METRTFAQNTILKSIEEKVEWKEKFQDYTEHTDWSEYSDYNDCNGTYYDADVAS